jgi:hypothetical protein
MVVPAAAASSKFACALKRCRWHSSIILAQGWLGTVALFSILYKPKKSKEFIFYFDRFSSSRTIFAFLLIHQIPH